MTHDPNVYGYVNGKPVFSRDEFIYESRRRGPIEDDTALVLLPDGFDVIDQLSELLAERKKLHIIDEENLRYNCDIIALEYAIGALRR